MNDTNIDETTVDNVYNNQYFKLSKQLQRAIGLWPYQTGCSATIRYAIVYFILIVFLIPVVNGCRVWCGVNLDICCENLIGIIYVLELFIKCAVPLVCRDNIKLLYKTVAKNWLNLIDPEERKIILKYATLGKMKSVSYFVYMLCCAIVVSQAPLLPVFLDLIKPLNKSREKILFVKAEYIIDPFEHYYKIYVCFCILCLLSLFLFGGIDGFYTLITHQNLALFSIVKYRLELATSPFSVANNHDYKLLVKAISLHKESIELTNLLEISYSAFFLLTNLVTVSFISCAAIVTVRILDGFEVEEDLFEFVRITMLEFGVLIHLFYLTWPGQLFLDHSEDLFVSAYTNEWYNISKRGKTLLKIMMLRFTKPSALTAAGLCPMNFENYGAIVKTAMSYITVAISFRN